MEAIYLQLHCHIIAAWTDRLEDGEMHQEGRIETQICEVSKAYGLGFYLLLPKDMWWNNRKGVLECAQDFRPENLDSGSSSITYQPCM